MLAIGMKRAVEEDDIYDVTNSMRSETNTEAFAQLWQLELKKKNPSILRVFIKIHGFKVISLGILFSIGETIARYVALTKVLRTIKVDNVFSNILSACLSHTLDSRDFVSIL